MLVLKLLINFKKVLIVIGKVAIIKIITQFLCRKERTIMTYF